MKRPRGLQRKGLADKVRAEMKRWPRSMADELRHDVAAHVRTARHKLRQTSEYDDPQDAADFVELVSGMAALQGVLGALEETTTIGMIAETIAEAEEEYVPGGPPMSPVHDTLFMLWSTLDLRFGRAADSVATIALGLGARIGLDDEARAAVARMARSRFGLYRIVSQREPRVGAAPIHVVRELVTEQELRLQCIEVHDVRGSDTLLLRPFELSESSARARGVSHIAIATPYAFIGTEPMWLDYLEREAAELRRRLDAASYELIMRGEGNPGRWLDYVFNGYAGTRANNLVVVTGIPDRPETLPHHEDFEGEAELAIPPGTPDRERATLLSARLARRCIAAMSEQPASFGPALKARFEALGLDESEVEEWQQLLMPVVMYQVGPSGESPVVSQLVDELDADEREYATAGLRGVASVFEAEEVEPGVGMRVRDLLGDGEYDVEERSGTMHLPVRTLLLGRLVEYRGIWMVDGLVPRPAHPRVREELLLAMGKIGTDTDAREHPLNAGVAIFEAMRVWREVTEADRRRRAEAPQVELRTTTGEPIAYTTIVLGFDPPRRADVLDAVARLRGVYEDEDEDEAEDERGARLDRFDLVSRGTLEGRLAVGPDFVEIESNAEARATRIQKRLQGKLRGVLRRRDMRVESPDEALAGHVPTPRDAPTPEVREIFQQVLQQHYATFLDTPVPALDGQPPRAAAKDPKLRDKLDTLLREHEFGVTRQHGAGVIDFDAMRRLLGLDG